VPREEDGDDDTPFDMPKLSEGYPVPEGEEL
jgi:hypothetical protein